MTIRVGEVVTLTYHLTVDDEPADATVELTLIAPDGSTTTPALQNPTVGTYTVDHVVDQAGTWYRRFEATGAALDVDEGTFDVNAPLDQADLPVLVSVTTFQRIVGDAGRDTADEDLLLFLKATDEVVTGIVGPLDRTVPIPSRWRLAARIIAAHLWDHWQGAVPANYQAGTDEGVSLSGFAVPKAARELLATESGATPRGSFPTDVPVWPR